MKKILSLVLSVIFMLGCASPVCFGIEHHIRSVSDFVEFARGVNSNGRRFGGSHIVLDKDINLVFGYGPNRNNITVGTSQTPFCGTFHGNGHSIRVAISSDENDLGLFRFAQDATFENLNITGSVIGNHNIGAILGTGDAVTFINCCNSAFVSGSENVGALAGHCTASIQNCANFGEVYQNGRLVNYIDGLENFIGIIDGWRIFARR